MIRFIFKFILILFSLELLLHLVKPESLEFYRVQKSYHKLDPDFFVDLESDVDVTVRHFQKTFDMKFTTNEKGFRASENVQNDKDQIICIGDSVSMGFGVNDEDSFCKKLDHFKDKNGKDYQVLNLSVDAYGPSAIYLKLKKNLPYLNSKVLYYFPSNGDQIDEEKFYSKKNSQKENFLFKLQFQLSKYSYLFLAFKIFQENLVYRFNETFIWNFKSWKKIYQCRNSFSEECIDSKIPSFNLINDLKIPKRKNLNAPPDFKESICSKKEIFFDIPQNLIAQIDNIIKISTQYNIKLVFFLAPIDLETAYCSQKGLFHEYYSFHSTLKKYLIQKNIDFVDLNQFTKSMIDEKNQYNVRPYYIMGDGHFTKKGNEWVYQIMKHKTAQILPLEK